MTLDFLSATETHHLELDVAREHGRIIVDFLAALRDVHIIRGVWEFQNYRKHYGSPDNDSTRFAGITIHIDSRPWR